MKTCTKCKVEKSLEEFFKGGKIFKNPRINKDGRSTVCKKCTIEKNSLNRKENQERYTNYGRIWTAKNKDRRITIRRKWQNSPKGYYAALKKRGIDNVKISQEDFLNWYRNQKKECFYCNLPESLISIILPIFFKSNMNRRLTIDRIIPKGNYEESNMVLACGLCNSFKVNVFTKEEMLEVGKIINKKWKKLYEQFKDGGEL